MARPTTLLEQRECVKNNKEACSLQISETDRSSDCFASCTLFTSFKPDTILLDEPRV